MQKLFWSLSLTFVLVLKITALPAASVVRDDRVRKALNRVKVSMVLFRKLMESDLVMKNALKDARAIAIFPVVSKSRGLWGSKITGEGIISRRIGGRMWTAPAFFGINKKTSTGINGSPSTIVLLFKDDAAVDALRTHRMKLGSDQALKVVDRDDLPATSSNNVSAFEYVQGIAVTSNLGDSQIKTNDSDNKAVYKLDSSRVLFYEREQALNVHHEDLYAFAATMQDVAPNDIDKPKFEDFFPGGFTYPISKSRKTVEMQIQNYFNSRFVPSTPDPIHEAIITDFRDLSDRGRRRRHAAFLIEIFVVDPDHVSVHLRWQVGSLGADRTQWIIDEDDRNTTVDNDEKFKEYLQPVTQEIEKLNRLKA